MASTGGPRATVAVISIGEMGLGISKLLVAYKYKVITNVSDRSPSTQKRAAAANLTLVPSDTDLVSQADYILSIVPPRYARRTARRFVSVFPNSSRPSKVPLYYLDLNAIAPSTSKSIASEFDLLEDRVRYLDGGIIGGPPKPKTEIEANGSSSTVEDGSSWTRPSIPVSGPYRLMDAPNSGAHLSTLLNSKHVSDTVGTASGLKCCFASMTKGFTALAIQSFTTASALGVLPELEAEVATFSGPQQVQRCRKSIVGMAPKAGRWVEEMREIGKTFEEDGGWQANIFAQVAGVYDFVAEGTVLGKEKTEERVRGATYGDAVEAIREGLDGKTPN